MGKTYFASQADDNTPFVTCDSINDVIKSLENDSVQLFKWFTDNQMEVNQDKCQLLINTNENNTINVDGNITEKSN